MLEGYTGQTYLKYMSTSLMLEGYTGQTYLKYMSTSLMLEGYTGQTYLKYMSTSLMLEGILVTHTWKYMSTSLMLEGILPLQKCCIRFAHIVGNILHAICMYATYYLMSICICANYKKLTKNWAYAQNMRSTKYISFAYMQNMCRIQSMQNVCILHTCIVRACCIYALCI